MTPALGDDSALTRRLGVLATEILREQETVDIGRLATVDWLTRTLLVLLARESDRFQQPGLGIGLGRSPAELLTLRKTNLTNLAVWGLFWPGLIVLTLAAGQAASQLNNLLEDTPLGAVEFRVASGEGYAGEERASYVAAVRLSDEVWFEGTYSEYEEDRHRRLGPAADRPHRITYRKLRRA